MSGSYPSDWDSRRKSVRERDNYTCQNCGREGGPSGDVCLEVHHIVPIRNGGSHRMGNLRTLCKGCHDAITHDQNAPTATNQRSELKIGEDELSPHTAVYFLLSFVYFALGSILIMFGFISGSGIIRLFVIHILFVSFPYILYGMLAEE